MISSIVTLRAKLHNCHSELIIGYSHTARETKIK